MRHKILLFASLLGCSLPIFAGELPFDVNRVIEHVGRRHEPINDVGSQFAYHNYFTDFGNDEFLLDTNIIYGPAPRYQMSPSISFDGTNYLVVWEDSRSVYLDIYGARVSTNGTILDTAGIPISTAGDDQRHPSISFDGNNYFIVWQDERSGWEDFRIYGARVSIDGIVLDTTGILISTTEDKQEYPSISFDGSNYFVVWQNWSSSDWDWNIYGARISKDGTVLDTMGIPISTAEGWQLAPSISFDGNNYLVVWEDIYWGIYGARVSRDGNVLDTGGIPISTAAGWQEYPSIAFDGTNYFVVWQDKRSGDYDIYGTRVSTNGAVLDAAGILISTIADDQLCPSISFDGINYLVIWESGYVPDIYGARVAKDGIVLDPGGIPISTAENNQRYPSISFDRNNYFIVWQDERSGDCDIYGTSVSTTGAVSDTGGILISTAANYQSKSSISFDGTDYFVVWSDFRRGYSDIYGTHVSNDGIVLDTESVPISTAANYQGGPSISFDGTDYFVVWANFCSSDSNIYGARVSTDGTVLDPAGIPISTAEGKQWRPSIAFDGNNYLVVWEDWRSGGWGNLDIYGARVSIDGTVLDPSGIPISTVEDNQESPLISFDGNNYFIVWQDEHSGWENSDIYGARVSKNGNILDTGGIPISVAEGMQWHPSIAFDGNNYLVVWEDRRSGYADVYGARVSKDGNVLDPVGIPISTAAYDQLYPSLLFNGTNYFVVWMDLRSGEHFDIYGALISTNGTVVDSFAVSVQPDNQILPALARGQGNQILICWSGFTPEINGKPANTMRIWGKFYPFTGVEEQRSQTLKFALIKTTPNPFYNKTIIHYAVETRQRISLNVYDISGRLVKTIENDIKLPGAYKAEWDGVDNRGRQLPSGIYFCQLKLANGYISTIKTLLLR